MSAGERVESYAVDRSRASMIATSDSAGRVLYRHGYVTTTHGVVGVYQEMQSRSYPKGHTMFVVAHEGREWRFIREAAPSDRGIATIAGRLTDRVVRQGERP